jgi:hypothetical protein
MTGPPVVPPLEDDPDDPPEDDPDGPPEEDPDGPPEEDPDDPPTGLPHATATVAKAQVPNNLTK